MILSDHVMISQCTGHQLTYKWGDLLSDGILKLSI